MLWSQTVQTHCALSDFRDDIFRPIGLPDAAPYQREVVLTKRIDSS
jgi:hypothetical protein